MVPIPRQRPPHNRRGVIALIVACALLVVLGCVALVVNRLWLENARVELTRCAEAAALAAGRELADDDRLRPGRLEQRADRIAARARQTAANIAARNAVAGDPVSLRTGAQGDVKLGKLVRHAASGRVRFLETERNATTVRVTARRARVRNNPVALLLAGATSTSTANVIARAEATIDNRIVGVRPLETAPVPALPLAILLHDPTGQRTDTWRVQVEQRRGPDDYGYDREAGRITRQADGVPEIHLKSMRRRGKPEEANVHLLTGLSRRRPVTGAGGSGLVRQIRDGWTTADFASLDGELRFDAGSVPLKSISLIGREPAAALRSMTGRCRICLLYTGYEAERRGAPGRVRCAGMAAGRVMDVSRSPNGAVRIVFQPGVLTTRTALLAWPDDPAAGDAEAAFRNPYIYKLRLTR